MGIEKGAVVRALELAKDYGSSRAVDGVSFEVKKGEIFGLLGPNGAGKTTTIRMLTGIIKPTSGSSAICGHDAQKEPVESKQASGVVPEMGNAYLDLSALGNLLFMGELYGIGRKNGLGKAEMLLKTFGLYEKRHQVVKTFSKGMRQRVILAMALMNDSEVLFLDEPTSGLDVESTRLLRDIIRKTNDAGATILLTTHDMNEADQLCDRIAIMDHGKIVAVERPEKLKQIVKKSVSVEVSFEREVDARELVFKGIERAEKRGDKVRLYTESTEEAIPRVVKYSNSTRNKIVSLNTVAPSLEDIFLKLTGGKE